MKRSLAALVAGAALLVGGCTPLGSLSSGGQEPYAFEALSDGAPAGFERYYSQNVAFLPCEAAEVTTELTPVPDDLDRYWCATVEAPMNWDDASSDAIDLAVAVYQPTGGGRDLLFFNLGGPGGNAVNSFSVFNEQLVPPSVLDHYDIVAIDPRGVGESSPVTCWDDAERDEMFSAQDEVEVDLEDDVSLDQLVADADKETAEVGAQCLDRSGEVVGYVDSDSAARDFDMVRALLGQEQMNYLGYSYGTALGAMYADIFPDRVGRFVLDGALDPAVDINQLSALQVEGMEAALYHWIESCQLDSACPITGDLEDGKQQMIDFFDSLIDEPLDTGEADRPLTEPLARTGVIGSLYSVDSYSLLTMAMESALGGDGSILLTLADFYNGRGNDGTYDNTQDAFTAINSLDYEPVGEPEEWLEQSDQLSADYPVLGPGFGLASAGLGAWPFEARAARHAVSAAGAAPILIVGTTHDPATPYVMAESLAESLDSGVLLTAEGWSHGAYQQGGSDCVLGAVDSFLLNGDAPEAGTVCEE